MSGVLGKSGLDPKRKRVEEFQGLMKKRVKGTASFRARVTFKTLLVWCLYILVLKIYNEMIVNHSGTKDPSFPLLMSKEGLTESFLDVTANAPGGVFL